MSRCTKSLVLKCCSAQHEGCRPLETFFPLFLVAFPSASLYLQWEAQGFSSGSIPIPINLSFIFFFFSSGIYFMFVSFSCMLSTVNGRNRKPWDSAHIYCSICPTSIFDLALLCHGSRSHTAQHNLRELKAQVEKWFQELFRNAVVLCETLQTICLLQNLFSGCLRLQSCTAGSQTYLTSMRPLTSKPLPFRPSHFLHWDLCISWLKGTGHVLPKVIPS